MLRWRRGPNSAPQSPSMRPKISSATVNEVEQLVENLGPEGVTNLSRSWQLCAEPEGQCGREILMFLLRNEQQFASYFGVVQNATQDEIRAMGFFPTHARRIHAFLDTVVMSITNESVPKSVLANYCHRVGSIHFYRGVNFAEENWVYFQCITLREILLRCEADDSIRSYGLGKLWSNWKQILNLVVEQMRNGFLIEAMENFSSKSPGSMKISKRALLKPTISTSAESLLNPKTDLNDQEMKLVRASWQEASDANVGLTVLIQMLASKPNLCTHFGLQNGATSQSISSDPTIRVQAQRIDTFLHTIVHFYGLQSKESLKRKCRRAGVMHFKNGINFTADLWMLFKCVTIRQVTTEKRTLMESSKAKELRHKTEDAWNKLLNFVIREMKAGFLDLAVAPAGRKRASVH